MKIREAHIEMTGADSDRHATGTATLHFSNGRILEVQGVRCDKFESWVASGYDPSRVPYDMSFALRQHFNLELEEDLDSLEDEFQDDLAALDEGETDEDWDDESDIRADDFVGQATGFPSFGYEKTKIRSDDFLGQITGRPTPGFEPENDE